MANRVCEEEKEIYKAAVKEGSFRATRSQWEYTEMCCDFPRSACELMAHAKVLFLPGIVVSVSSPRNQGHKFFCLSFLYLSLCGDLGLVVIGHVGARN